jgi:hypothetical protein
MIILRARSTPAERERRRRFLIHSGGRLTDGIVMDVSDGVVYYCYSWRGVDYETSQDLRPIEAVLPHPHDRLVGPVTLKFLPRDPSNSIVACEQWSGFVNRRAVEEAG